MSEELKACPWCNCAVDILEYPAKTKITIKCPRCITQRTQRTILSGMDWLRDNMIRRWNRRASPWVRVEDRMTKKVLISLNDFAKIIGVDGKTFYEGCCDPDFERLKKFQEWFDAQPDAPINISFAHRVNIKEMEEWIARYRQETIAVLSKMETTKDE